jgi:hypothetical protein
MKISRRPNSRASSENAPGPRKAIAVVIAMTSMIAALLSKRFAGGAGIHERAYPIVPSTTMTLVAGVSIPTRRQIPPDNPSTTATNVIHVSLCQSLRYAEPCINKVEPATTLKSSRPTPGNPAGKVENNLCRASLPNTYVFQKKPHPILVDFDCQRISRLGYLQILL